MPTARLSLSIPSHTPFARPINGGWHRKAGNLGCWNQLDRAGTDHRLRMWLMTFPSKHCLIRKPYLLQRGLAHS